MKSLALGLALSASLCAHPSMAKPPKTRPWSALLAPRTAFEPGLCNRYSSVGSCVESRYTAWMRELDPDALDEETAVTLCELGMCRVNSTHDGPWLLACRRTFQATNEWLFESRRSCPEGRKMAYTVKMLAPLLDAARPRGPTR